MSRRHRDQKAATAGRADQKAATAGRAEPNAATTDRLRPWLLTAACALVMARPLYPSESAALYGDGLPVVMLWIALAVFWLLGVIGRPAFRARFGWTDAAVALLVVLHTVAGVGAALHGAPRPALNMLWEWIAYGLSFFMLRQLVVGPRETRAVMAGMVAVAVALAGHGLYQYFHKMPARLAAYEKDPDGMLRNEGMWIPPGTQERVRFEDRLRSKEPMASFALANSLAGYLAPWLLVLVGIGVGGGWAPGHAGMLLSRKRLGIWGIAIGGCALVVGACLVLTKSRSAYLAALLGAVLVGRFCRPPGMRVGWKFPAVAAAAVAALVATAIAVRGLDVEVWSEAAKSFGYRVQYWQATMRVIGHRPWLGCGPGQFRDAYTAYKLPEASEEVADPHNFLLEVWATAGTPAMLALLAVLACYGVALRCHDRAARPDSEPAPSESLGRPAFALAGLVLGFLLAVPLALISEAPPGLEVQWLGLPLAAVTIAVLYPWIARGTLPAALPAVGIAVLLVNLLAAGGIGFPGVAGTLWLLLALGLTQSEPVEAPKAPRIAAVTGLAVAVALAVACYATAYRPVLESQAALRAAERSVARREAFLYAAASADPLSAEPWARLAALDFERWQLGPASAKLERFEQAMANALRLSPQSSALWLAAGSRYLEVADRPGVEESLRSEAIGKAVTACRRAVELYPNNGVGRATLAVALDAAGDQEGFRQQAEAALRLDALTPHADRKLPDELRNRLLRNDSRRRLGP